VDLSNILTAVAGGFVLGGGVGWLFGRIRGPEGSREMTQLAAQMRRSVIPILERQADALGLPRAKRSWDTTDDFQVTVGLAAAIQDHEAKHDLPYSDTMEVHVENLDGG
jgi:hypothetical protein